MFAVRNCLPICCALSATATGTYWWQIHALGQAVDPYAEVAHQFQLALCTRLLSSFHTYTEINALIFRRRSQQSCCITLSNLLSSTEACARSWMAVATPRLHVWDAGRAFEGRLYVPHFKYCTVCILELRNRNLNLGGTWGIYIPYSY